MSWFKRDISCRNYLQYIILCFFLPSQLTILFVERERLRLRSISNNVTHYANHTFAKANPKHLSERAVQLHKPSLNRKLFLEEMKAFCKYFTPFFILVTLLFSTLGLSTLVGGKSHLSGRYPKRQGLSEIFTCPEKQEDAINGAEDRLIIIFQVMTSFVKGRSFDSEAFAKVQPNIDHEIQEIGECVQKKAPTDTLLLSQLEFVELASQDYLNAVEYLRYYTSNKTYQQLARSVIKLNVFLITLQDSFGIPKREIVDYDDFIAKNIDLLDLWASMFLQLTELPPGMDGFFDSQYTRARQRLQWLASHGKDHGSWNAATIATAANSVYSYYKFIVESGQSLKRKFKGFLRGNKENRARINRNPW
ncbi:hypothetical protein METSCH_B05100 [Metschnikowia aff. pulcherrima]|uniref:Uncharacterized protein n=1 Tax=Metschnikowia aff. pulcherrima TaxID=2163413 RepID=A0A4P6XMR7_9ASCO|nr:hypothetical protein METSCH_B05100 [Metschnikowia aff. pulcherrima]